jgi:DNA polymerase-3 subunit alpha
VGGCFSRRSPTTPTDWKMLNYAPLHVHTDIGSLMDGVATPEEYAARAASLEMPAIACTDHGSLSAHRRFYRACKDNGVKPILGMEAYITSDRFDRRDKGERTTPLDLVYNHIIVLAQNKQGLQNLNRLNEIAWTEGFYKKPRIDFDVLDKYGDGLIISSACMSGLINKAIELDEYAAAKQHIQWFTQRFGKDNFFVEVMPHNIDGMNEKLFALANEMGAKCIVTPDCHHCTKDQKVIQEMMLILNTHAKIQKDVSYEKSAKYQDMMERLDYLYGADRQMSFRSFDIHLLDYDEMNTLMSDSINDDSIYRNTLDIADMVEDYDIPRNLNLLPVKVDNADDQLRKYAVSWLKDKDLHTNQVYVDRLNDELKIIKDKEFAPYFLVVHNMISWAKSQGILVGPGRGSAAGSLVCYALGITDIDPIKYGLLFFRFINPERNDFPDIDTDIQDNRREEVKQYLEREYGNVASIATFLSFKDKVVVRDVARVLHVPLSDVNRLMKSVDKWDDFTDNHNTKWFREKYPEVLQYAEKIRGRVRGTGIHAAGIVTSKEPIFKYAPMETRLPTGSKDRIPVVAVDMEEAADIGLIKIDALGLNTLTVIDDTLKIINERHHKKIDLSSLPLNDSNVFDMLSNGFTKGVFQCEASPYTNLLVKMGVRNFDELVASNALVRPGAMNTIGRDYIARKNGKAIVEYVHPVMKNALSDTYGCILYQEQVMLACHLLGGMSMSVADKIRKIIGKKKDAHEFDQFKEEFVKGASRYISPATASHLWTEFEAHAGYSFNKSHAVAYSTLSYWTAWLKYHYPIEFMFALLKNEKDKDARTGYLIEAKRMGISLKLPHINESDMDFKIEGKGIRFGLGSIKWISDGIASKILEARPFHSYEEVRAFGFKKGSGVNSRAVEAMNAIGALTFTDNPRDETKVRSNLYEYLNLPEFTVNVPQQYYAFIENFEDFDELKSQLFVAVAKKIKRAEGWSKIDFLDKTGTLGLFDTQETSIETGKTYLLLSAANRVACAIPIDELQNYRDHPLIRFLNYKEMPYDQDEYFIITFRTNVTKAGKKMAYITAADYNRNLYPVVSFSGTFANSYMLCEPGKAVKMKIGTMKDGTTVLEEVRNGN